MGVYNIHKKEIKRTIYIKDIGGLTKTVPPSKAQEFTIHVPQTYDYRFSSQRREAIIDIIKRLYLIEHKKNCLMFHVTTKDLKDFTTTEKDMKKRSSKFPPNEFLNHENDLMVLSTPTLATQSTIESEDGLGNLDEKQDIRRMQINDGESGSEYTDETMSRNDTEDDDQLRQSMVGGARPVFSRNKVECRLEDFKILKMIGKGTFGKVFLVENQQEPGKMYAMKCIRKDIILENEQMDNIQLEKDILYTIDHPFLVNMEYVF